MDSQRSATIRSNGEDSSLLGLVRGERTRALVAQLGDWHPECSADEIEDAIQTACKRFLEHAEGITAPGEVYTWVRTTAHRLLNRETARHVHEFGVERIDERMADIPDEDAGPEEELIGREDDADLAALVEEVNSSLPQRKRDILALWTAGEQRPEIAERLGLSQRKVKRELLEIMDDARAALARMAGGGCRYGEPLVLRSVCGLADVPKAIDEPHAGVVRTGFDEPHHIVVPIGGRDDERAIERLDALAAQGEALPGELYLPAGPEGKPGREHREQQGSDPDQEVASAHLA